MLRIARRTLHRVRDTTKHRLSVKSDLRNSLTSQARALGFDCAGVTAPDAVADAAKHFRAFLEAGAHGDMDWLAAHPERRTDPR